MVIRQVLRKSTFARQGTLQTNMLTFWHVRRTHCFASDLARLVRLVGMNSSTRSFTGSLCHSIAQSLNALVFACSSIVTATVVLSSVGASSTPGGGQNSQTVLTSNSTAEPADSKQRGESVNTISESETQPRTTCFPYEFICPIRWDIDEDYLSE